MEKQINTENLSLASMQNRLKAYIVDDLLMTLIILVMLWDVIAASSGDFATVLEIMNSNFWQLIIMKFFYHFFFIWYYGATLGKMYAKIRVIDYDNFGRVGVMASVIRSVSRILSEMFFYVGFFLAYFNPERQTFQDKVSKTLVVNA